MISKISSPNCALQLTASAMSRDTRFMRLALALGRRGQGTTWPNPAVGCVIAHGDRILGRGWTQPGGRPHAERMALAQAGPAAKGATVYVTLEPCAHTGQTPPCAQALIDAKVAKVVIALLDPDQRVAGRGLAMLREAGIVVETGCCARQAWLDHRGFLSRLERGLPMVTLKLATSFDGRIATRDGESQWITGPDARRFGHMLRARHDAVLIGAGTARSDNPTLTARDMGVVNQPVRVVASRILDVPSPSRLLQTVDTAPVWYVHGPLAPDAQRTTLADQGAHLIQAELSEQGRLDPVSMLQVLAKQGLTRVYCEGGGDLAAALLSAGLVDDLYVFTAGLAIGAEGRPALGAMELMHLYDAARFRLVQTESIGEDTVTLWRAPS